MNLVLRSISSNFPKAPALIFSTWIVLIVAVDIWETLGFGIDTIIGEKTLNPNTVTHYVIFQTTDLGKISISLGSQFPSNDGSAPEKQWCYADAIHSDGTHRIHITLAEKQGTHAVEYLDITQASASNIGSHAGELKKLAKSHCKFL